MNQLDARLNDLLEPVRDQGVGALLQGLAAALESSPDVAAEPVLRDIGETVRRYGPLQLPERADLKVVHDGRRLFRRIESGPMVSFEPVSLVAEGGFTAVLTPFLWEAAPLLVESAQPRPDWRPLRLWYLEWFQPRFTEVSPDLGGVVHSLSGPLASPDGWRIEVDFGSVPLAAIPALIDAVGRSGALRLRLGRRD